MSKRKIYYRKFLVTHKWGDNNQYTSTNAFIIPDHYNHSLDTFQEMTDEARKDFPNLKNENVECRTVLQSNWCKGFPIIHFHVPANTKMEGWNDCKDRLPDMQW